MRTRTVAASRTTLPTTKLLTLVAGEEASSTYARTGSLWQLLDETERPADPRLHALRTLIDRLIAEPRPVGRKVCSPEDIAELFRHLTLLDHEELHCVFLDIKHRVIATERVAVGGVSSVEIQPARIFRLALKHNASAVIACHNHPSGSPEPSTFDVALTKRLTDLGLDLGIPLLDHIIVAGDRHFAFAEHDPPR